MIDDCMATLVVGAQRVSVQFFENQLMPSHSGGNDAWTVPIWLYH
jgi:hypothetical protein